MYYIVIDLKYCNSNYQKLRKISFWNILGHFGRIEKIKSQKSKVESPCKGCRQSIV